MIESDNDTKFVWVWSWYRFRGMEVLVIRKRQAQTNAERNAARALDLPLKPDIITYRDSLGLEHDIAEPEFEAEAEHIASHW